MHFIVSFEFSRQNSAATRGLIFALMLILAISLRTAVSTGTVLLTVLPTITARGSVDFVRDNTTF